MHDSERPNPDALIFSAAQEADAIDAPTGRMKVFFGAAPGVGKTFAMLEEARKAASEGADVVIGYAEPHIRPETESLLLGMEILPSKIVEYRSSTLKEFDLEAALKRRPKILCVDELAHTNAHGMLHQKRWQDVFDLLDSGIDVYTTLNVQHLESVNDIVERITGVKVNETLPDEVLDRADEIELIDTTPEELTERLREGKVYRPDIAERAIRQFFNKGNLTALRELALRKTAERVDAQMREHRDHRKASQTWAASERLLVCVGPSPLSARLVRSAKRLATSLRSPWSAVTVETPATAATSQSACDRTAAHLRLAQRLGGDAITLSGESVARTLIDYARQHNVTKIVIGKPELPRWKERVFGSVVDDVIRGSGDIDVYVIRGEASEPPKTASPSPTRSPDWTGYIAAILATVITTSVGWLMHREAGLSDTNVLMFYLLGVLVVSWRFSRRASALAALLSVLTFDFVFVPPFLSFAVSDRQDIITFMVMLTTALLTGTLVARIRSQAQLFKRRQEVTQTLLDFSTEVTHHIDPKSIAQITVASMGKTFNCDAAVMVRDDYDQLCTIAQHGTVFADNSKEAAVARWVLDHDQSAGAGTATLPMAAGAYVPLHGSGRRVIGVLGLRPIMGNPLRDPSDLRLLESLALQASVAIERAQLAGRSRDAWRRVEQESLRNTLLSAVGHDMRTPLTAITGSASVLVEPSLSLSDDARRELADIILTESRRMERIIANLLDVTRLESGETPTNRQLVDVGELVVAVRTRLHSRLGKRAVTVTVQPEFPDVWCDPFGIDQVISNLIENAIDHTAADTAIDISASFDEQSVHVHISDHGPGIPAGNTDRIFEKFARLSSATDRRGLGLGLAISKAIIESNRGTISAANREGGGGACFRFSLPRGEMNGS